jgi:AcrR family transcriptional regulator
VTTTEQGAEGARIWGGTTLDERRAARRRQLLDTGLDLLGGESTGAVSVRAACRGAKLTERYFYESFADRDALVLAVYEDVADAARAALEEATRSAKDPVELARRSIEAMVGLMVDDPRKGRVLLVSPITEPALASRSMELASVIGGMIRSQLPPGTTERTRALIATGLLGALMSLFYTYLRGTLRVSREEFIEHCVSLLLNVDKLR